MAEASWVQALRGCWQRGKKGQQPQLILESGTAQLTGGEEGASCPQNLWETAPQPMGREGMVGSSTMKCRGDFISNRTWAERLQGCLFPQLHPEGLGGTSPSSQPRSHFQPSLAQSPGLFVCRAAEEESGSRERAGGGGSAAELIRSFKGDGELSQVHIKGQGNEC